LQRTEALEKEIERRQAVERLAAETAQHEQERVAQALHDQLGAHLAGIAFRAKLLAERLEERSPPEAAQANSLLESVNQAAGQVHSLAQILMPLGKDETLEAALSRLGRETETVFGITCPVDLPRSPLPLNATQARHLYQLAQEAVRNAVQHGQAEIVKIGLGVEQDSLRLSVESDGRTWTSPSGQSKGLGLRIMQSRVETLGGTLTIRPKEGGGAIVMCTVPLERLRSEVKEV
jgi:signal transduction histidine kinase